MDKAKALTATVDRLPMVKCAQRHQCAGAAKRYLGRHQGRLALLPSPYPRAVQRTCLGNLGRRSQGLP